MEKQEKKHLYSDVLQQPEASTPDKETAGEQRRRLRDRELLKKRKAEAEEKETYQETLKSKRQRKGRTGGTKGGRHHSREPEEQPEEEAVQKEPEPAEHTPAPEPEPKEEQAEAYVISDNDEDEQPILKGTTTVITSTAPEVTEVVQPQETGSSEAFDFPEEHAEEPAYEYFPGLY